MHERTCWFLFSFVLHLSGFTLSTVTLHHLLHLSLFFLPPTPPSPSSHKYLNWVWNRTSDPQGKRLQISPPPPDTQPPTPSCAFHNLQLVKCSPLAARWQRRRNGDDEGQRNNELVPFVAQITELIWRSVSMTHVRTVSARVCKCMCVCTLCSRSTWRGGGEIINTCDKERQSVA